MLALYFNYGALYQYAAKVSRWVDGDSLIASIDCGFSVFLHDQQIRLTGIDTSETRGGTPELKWLGNLAKQYVNDACPVGSDIIIKTSIDKKGKFGRLLGEIFYGDDPVSLNENLKLQRLAVPYMGQKKAEVIALHNLNIEWHKQQGTI